VTDSDDTVTSDNKDRGNAAAEIGREEDKVTSAAQEVVESVTDEVADAVDKAEDAAETVVEAVLDASETAAEKNDIPELASAVANIVIERLRAAGLSVSQVTEEATEAAQDVAETIEDIVDTSVGTVSDVSDSIAPKPDHWFYAWPPKFPRRKRS
jgi:uncharacterized protein YjbJ (UPF0337 family)